MGCNCCAEPPTSLHYAWERQIGLGNHTSSSATAWTNAVANIPTYTGTFSDGSFSGTGTPNRNEKQYFGSLSGLRSAIAERQKYKWRFYTGTCYFKIWWDEVTRHSAGTIGTTPSATVTATNSLEWEWTPSAVDNLCLPSGFDQTDATTWSESGVYEILETEPSDPGSSGDVFDRLEIQVENVRFTWVVGYTPASFSVSGFPPP